MRKFKVYLKVEGFERNASRNIILFSLEVVGIKELIRLNSDLISMIALRSEGVIIIVIYNRIK